MTAEITILPVKSRPPARRTVPLDLEGPIFNKLMIFAEKSDLSIENAAVGLIVHALATFECQEPTQFYRALMGKQP